MPSFACASGPLNSILPGGQPNTGNTGDTRISEKKRRRSLAAIRTTPGVVMFIASFPVLFLASLETLLYIG